MVKLKVSPGVPSAVSEMIALWQAQQDSYQRRADEINGYVRTVQLPVLQPEPEADVVVLTSDELLEECSKFPETDIGNAERLLERYGDRIRHITHIGWHGFDGNRWLEDASGSVVRRLAHDTARFIDDEAIKLDCSADEQAKIADGKKAREDLKAFGKYDKTWDVAKLGEYERLQKAVDAMEKVEKDRAGRMSSRHGHAKSAAGTSKINNMLQEAVPYCSLDVGELNRDLMALNCRNGTLRFVCHQIEGSGKWQVRLDRHRSEDLISKLCDTAFDADAGAPKFQQFLQTVMPNPDYRAFLQRYMGYCLLGTTGEQCLVFFYGSGRNGKSTFIDIMVEILGDYAISMSIDSFAGDSKRGGAEATPDLARLPGARLVAASEPEMGVHLKDALIKTLTGGEPIAVRRLHQDFFELTPQFKIVLSGNHKPIIKDDSDGIWRRVHLVPWEIQIPEEDVDKSLKEKLLSMERVGIFAWMVQGALEYLQRGLQVPDGVRAATAEYREESDPIGAFLRHACDISGRDSDFISPLDLFNAYMSYARREGLAEFKQTTFNKRLSVQTQKSWKGADGNMKQFRRGKNVSTVYYGISVKDEIKNLPDDQSYSNNEPFPEDF